MARKRKDPNLYYTVGNKPKDKNWYNPQTNVDDPTAHLRKANPLKSSEDGKPKLMNGREVRKFQRPDDHV